MRIAIPPATGVRHAQWQYSRSGTLYRLSRDTCVVVFDSPESDTTAFALGGATGERLERYVGSRRHVLAGAGVGALLGMLLGGVLITETKMVQPCFFCSWQPHRETVAAPGAGAKGALGGAVFGAVLGLLYRTATWAPVRTAGLEIALTPRAAGLRLRF